MPEGRPPQSTCAKTRSRPSDSFAVSSLPVISATDPDHDRSVRAGAGLERGPADVEAPTTWCLGPQILLVVRVHGAGGFGVGPGVEMRGDREPERVRPPGALACRPVDVGQRLDVRERAAEDHRQPEPAGALGTVRDPPAPTHTGSGSCAARGPTNALSRPGRKRPRHVTFSLDRMSSRSPSFSANSVVVRRVVAEQGERLGERATSRDDLGPPWLIRSTVANPRTHGRGRPLR